MLALVVCVPIPALALSGLSVPLPSVVERVAAALVPFGGDAVFEDGAAVAAGQIVHAPGAERRADAPAARTAPRPATRLRRARQASAPAAAPTTQSRHGRPARVPLAKLAGGTTLEESATTTVAAPTLPETEPAPAPAPRPEEPKPTQERTKDQLTKTPDVSLDPIDDAVDTTPIPEPVESVVPPGLVDLAPSETEKPTTKTPADSLRDVVDRLGT
jgi:hypothetical protein